ncbi:HEAT repeat domain-containing protein [Streptomyces mirabilis]|uniref:HEAT repeat domain-containing protein n=1 Tax=Streptomyces mirabilis TaxID=68239 RepID=UPI00380D05EB
MVKTPERIGEEADLAARRLAGLALNPSAPQDVRQRIAYRADLGPAERRALAVDPDPKVRLAVSVHPALSEEERNAIDYEVPTDRGFHPPAPSVPREPEDVRRDALSAHPMPRRKAARVHELPPELVARLADHEDPEVRALAVRDPETAPAVVERLTRDPDPAVRAEAARHPNLPRPRLTELLDDEELAHPAAANPALDVAEIRRLARTPGDPAGPSVDTLI